MLRNTAFQIGGRAGAGVATLLANAILARHLDQLGYGKFALVLVCVGLGLAVVDSALTAIAIRELSQLPASSASLMGTLLILKLPSTVLSGVAAFALAMAVGDGQVMMMLSVGSLWIVATAAASVTQVVFAVRERMEFIALTNLLTALGFLTATVAVAWTGAGVLGAVLAYVFGSLVGLAASAALVLALFPTPVSRPVGSLLRKVGMGTALVSLNYASINLLAGLDSILLSRLRGVSAVALYAAAYRFVLMAVMVGHSFAFAAYPVISRTAGHNLKSAREIYQALWDTMILLAVPISVGTLFVAGDVMTTVYGDTYRQAADALRVLMASAGCMLLISQIDMVLIATGRQRAAFALSSSVLLVNLAANLLLIPRFGVVGAAWALLISLAIWVAVGYWVVSRILGSAVRTRTTARAGVAAVLASAVMLILPRLPWYVALMVFLAAYITALLLIRVRADYDVRTLRRVASATS